MGYKNVCLHCRKSYSDGTDHTLFRKNAICPQCKQPMEFVNHNFKPPKKDDIKAWEIVSYLIKNGFKYRHIEKDGEYQPYPTTMQEAILFVEKYSK